MMMKVAGVVTATAAAVSVALPYHPVYSASSYRPHWAYRQTLSRGNQPGGLLGSRVLGGTPPKTQMLL